jgi:hypothetical protein
MEQKNFKTYPEYKDRLIAIGKRVGLNLDLNNPKTIQDKINWMKLYDSTSLKTKCADKILVHDYCKEKLGVDLCIPILKIYDKVEDIKWDELPDRFVIKCNHGSGMNIIVKDKSKLNIPEAETKLRRFMKDDFAFHVGYEMHYHDIPHKIFVEEYKEDEKQKNSLFDYKFWCFNGEPRVMYCTNKARDIFENFYDMDFRPIMIDHGFKRHQPELSKPAEFELMKQLAAKLSRDLPFVRVDFFDVNGHVWFGEFTFYDWTGLKPFGGDWDDKLGEWIKLPMDNK